MTQSIQGRLVGRYVCGERMAEGGMASVFTASHMTSGQPAVVKVMSPEMVADPSLLARFEREVRALVGIRSSHVPQLYDNGQLPDGTPYMTIELCHGDTLAERIATSPIAIDDVVEIAAQLGRALEAIHAAGFVHRDIKPDNVLLHQDSDGRLRVRLIDFGICGLIPRGGPRHTLSDRGGAVGTPGYMSPEHTLGLPTHASSDLFSLGVTLYESLTGVMPFDADEDASLSAVLARVRTYEPPPVSALRPDCPEWLDALVGQMLEKRCADRPVCAAEVVSIIEGWTRTASTPPPPRPSTLPRLRLPDDEPVELIAQRWWSRLSWSRAAVVALVAGTLGFLGYATLFGPPLPDLAARYMGPMFGVSAAAAAPSASDGPVTPGPRVETP